MRSKKADQILRDIEQYFHFLIERGYKIQEVKELPMENWLVALSLDNRVIVIYAEQAEIGVLFSTLDSNLDYRVGLEGMIYYLSNGKTFVGKLEKSFFNARKRAFERLSSLLKEYFDQITPYFGADYERYKHEIMLAQQKYLDIFLDKYIPKQKRRDWE